MISFIMPPDLLIRWECWNMEVGRKRLRKGFRLIWVIWNMRNHQIFRNEVRDVDEIMDDIKVLAWRWSLARLIIPSYL